MHQQQLLLKTIPLFCFVLALWVDGNGGALALSVYPSRAGTGLSSSSSSLLSSSSSKLMATSEEWLEFQSDHGRGEDHLSAFVEEGDVIIYQDGTWFVDGVEVGDGSPTTFEYCRVETLQVVWTHNCEHGVIRGYQMIPTIEDGTMNVQKLSVSPDNFVELGPEQLVARLTQVEWDRAAETDEETATLPAPLAADVWQKSVLDE